MMKTSMQTVGKQFSSHRMLMEYHDNFYEKALANYRKATAKKEEHPKEVAAYLERLSDAWDQVSVIDLEDPGHPELHVGEDLEVTADVSLGPLSPDDVRVEAYFGHINSQGSIDNPQRREMAPVDGRKPEDGQRRYVARIPCDSAGRQGYSVRILPKHPDLTHSFLPGYIKWA
jgi:starch phosphorylase